MSENTVERKGVEYEQNSTRVGIAIVILRARSNRLADLVPHAPDCLARLGSIQFAGT